MLDFMLEKKKINDGMHISYGCGHFLGRDYDCKVREGKTPFFCTAGIVTGCVLSNGDIYVCPDVERRPELVQGNIRKDSFVDVWENKYEVYRSINRTSNEKCKKCKDWKLCCGDGFHTWDFDTNKPNFCIREIWKDKFKESKKKKSQE